MNGALTVLRDFLSGLIRELFPDPMVEVKGSHYVDVIVNRVNDKLAINLVNISGPHTNKAVYVYDEIPPVGPVEITVRMPEMPSKVTLELERTDMKYAYEHGILKLTLPRIEIHSIIVIEK